MHWRRSDIQIEAILASLCCLLFALSGAVRAGERVASPDDLKALLRQRADAIKTAKIQARLTIALRQLPRPDAKISQLLAGGGEAAADLPNVVERVLIPSGKDVHQQRITTFQRGNAWRSETVLPPVPNHPVLIQMPKAVVNAMDQPTGWYIDLYPSTENRWWALTSRDLLEYTGVINAPILEFTHDPPPGEHPMVVLGKRSDPTRAKMWFDSDWWVVAQEVSINGKFVNKRWLLGDCHVPGFRIPRIIVSFQQDALKVLIVEQISINIPVTDHQLTGTFPAPIMVQDRRRAVENRFELDRKGQLWNITDILQVADAQAPQIADAAAASQSAPVKTAGWSAQLVVVGSAIAVAALSILSAGLLRRHFQA